MALALSFCLVAAGSGGAASLPVDNAKYRAVRAVYDKIALAFGEGRRPPELQVRPLQEKGGARIAFFSPGTEGLVGIDAGKVRISQSFISIDEKVFDLFSDFGADRDNALAVLLAHELTHYYRNHGWLEEFGNAYAEPELRERLRGNTPQEMLRIEAEADYYGGFYGYLAGYDTLGLSERVLDTIYTSYGLKDARLTRYPTLAERKRIARTSADRLRNLFPLFEAGNQLLLLQRYAEAAQLFDYLARAFPSREMFNNAGVAYASAALELAPAAFVYPLEFDTQTLLQQGRRTRGERGATPQVQALLARAADCFDQALRRDPSYAPAFANRAAVYDLCSEPELALVFAGKAVALAEAQREEATLANAILTRGIVYAGLARTAPTGQAAFHEKASVDFSRGATINPSLAEFNRRQLEGATTLGFAGERPAGELLQFREETIDGLPPESVFALERFDTELTLSAAEGAPTLLFATRSEAGHWAFVAQGAPPTVVALVTAAGYAGASARGIRLGSTLDEVRETYGTPARTVAARQSTFLVYPESRVVFAVTPQQTVKGWMIYASE